MKTVGVIVEYNPLHNGHVYHFQQAKLKAGADAVVAIMSGHFLQRGEPALVNKWARADMALHMGADLVIELPIAFSVQPAEWFAFGAVSALHCTGVVDSLCFGSESDDLASLTKLAEHLYNEPLSLQHDIREQLKTGTNYPAAYSAAVQRHMNDNPQLSEFTALHLSQPNNILGLHYLIALARLQSNIKPLSITRQKSGYHQQDINDERIASATALRHLLFEQPDLSIVQPYVPQYTLSILKDEWHNGRAPMHWDRFIPQLINQLLNLNATQLAGFYEVSEGLENRLKQMLPQLDLNHDLTMDTVLKHLKTKRYTYAKLQRTLLRILLNHTKSELTGARLSEGVPYLRILGFSDKGRTLLKRMKTSAAVPVLSSITNPSITSQSARDFLAMDIRATSLYSFAYPSPSNREVFRDYYQAPIYFTGKPLR